MGFIHYAEEKITSSTYVLVNSTFRYSSILRLGTRHFYVSVLVNLYQQRLHFLCSCTNTCVFFIYNFFLDLLWQTWLNAFSYDLFFTGRGQTTWFILRHYFRSHTVVTVHHGTVDVLSTQVSEKWKYSMYNVYRYKQKTLQSQRLKWHSFMLLYTVFSVFKSCVIRFQLNIFEKRNCFWKQKTLNVNVKAIQ